ncbi:MAG: DNA alkylation repair protein [Oscillospiraceae bacterium]|nr:DNA alkylation repair protein [Oscillospiraceae bacterium]
MTELQKRLFSMQDADYQAFQRRLMPTVPPEAVIGVRTPALRELAKAISGTPDAEAFLAELPHRYYEENNLHGFLLCRIRDFGVCLAEVERFLPYVDNWATCDTLSPRAFARNPEALLEPIRRWLASAHVYTCRFGIGCLMRWFLDGRFAPEYLEAVAAIRSQEYYVNMMIAWYFATALAKQYDAVLPFLEQRRLDPWVHNKAIQKACESFRVPQERKTYLKSLKGLPE